MIRRLGRYEILGELARGGMGVVLRAHDPDALREVAIKVLDVDAQLDSTQVARFLTECEALSKLKHAGIVTVHDAGQSQGRPYLVQDLIEGPTLEQRLSASGPLPLDDAASVVAALAEAAEHAHEQGILHRDIKPSNVLLAAHGPVLVDFGLAKDVSLLLSGPSLTKTGLGFGTPGYWSPEQAVGEKQTEGEPVGPATDVYSLGATLYASLTGRPPFEGRTTLEGVIHTVSRRPTPPSRLRKEVDADLEAICLQCLEKRPRDRYPTAAALAEDLRRYQQRKPVAAGRRRRRRLLRRLTAILGVCVVTVIGSCLASASPDAVEPQTASVATKPDTTPPVLEIDESLPWSVVTTPRIRLRGDIRDESSVKLRVGATERRLNPGPFAVEVPLELGLNELEVFCKDQNGNEAAPLHLSLIRVPEADQATVPALLSPYVTGTATEFLVTETLLVPAGQILRIPAGSRLRFAQNAAIECKGQLWSLGTKALPVDLGPSGDHWGGLHLTGAGAQAMLLWTQLHEASTDPLATALRTDLDMGDLGGGGISVRGGGTLLLLQTKVSNCLATGGKGGGALLLGEELKPSRAHFVGTSFSGCVAQAGGGIHCGDYSTVRIEDSRFVENKSRGEGGAISVSAKGAALSVTSAHFVRNQAVGDGGGVHLKRAARVQSSSFIGNRARAGGGLSTVPGGTALSLEDSVFSENTVALCGGGANLESQAQVVRCVFARNTAIAGGGVRATGERRPMLENTTFESNTAHRGGGLFVEACRLTLRECTFSRNSATQTDGGGMLVASGAVLARESRFVENLGRRGGAAASWAEARIELSSSKFSENRATDLGGSLAFLDASRADIEDCVFETGRAAGEAQDIFLARDVTMTSKSGVVAHVQREDAK